MPKKNLEGGWWEPLAWFVLILVGFWVLWYYDGGPQQSDVNSGPFMHADAPVDNGQGYGQVGQ